MSLQIHMEAVAKYPYNTPTGYDHKAWVKRILYREERGDKDLMAIQIRFARDAMGRGLAPDETISRASAVTARPTERQT